MKKLLLIPALFCAFGCSNTLSKEADSVSSATVGATVAGKNQKVEKKQVIEYQEDILQGQEKQAYEQGKELDQIKRQEYWDQKLQKYRQ
ncbi:MAG: hypothetical protein J0M12_11060 [Deltaproteobacteria bacterium]|nr:hypothetical protein [Deltaproteobacteria bacterium]